MVRKNAVRLWAVVFWLVVWQLGSMAFGQTLLLPSPLAVLLRLASLAATVEFWSAVVDFFKAMGLDPAKPAELCYYQGTEQDLSGGGWYHLAGTVLEGSSQSGDCEVFPAGWYDLAEGFSVGFKNSCDLLPDDFPRPCFQMEFNHQMPWVLEVPNPYIYE